VVDNTFFTNRDDGNFQALISFGVVNILKRPPFEISISSSGQKLVVDELDDFNRSLMQRGLGFLIKNQMGFNQVALPKDHSSLLSSRKNLAIWKFTVSVDI
jgi:hypothetical protein